MERIFISNIMCDNNIYGHFTNIFVAKLLLGIVIGINTRRLLHSTEHIYRYTVKHYSCKMIRIILLGLLGNGTKSRGHYNLH